MNILHLKYATEVAKTKSINKAAENLFMAQPNLSRAIKELEDSLGIAIFNRTTKGISLTPEGEEFLGYARKILRQIDQVEAIYKDGKKFDKQKFSISVPRAGYIAHAFTEFAKNIDPEKSAEIFYKETNSSRVINNILTADYNLGILRYKSTFDKHFKTLLEEKGLKYELISEFSYRLLMSKEHPLADKEEIVYEDLTSFIEIAHGDPYVPSLPFAAVKKEELPDDIDKRIFVFERASQYDLLSSVPGTYMWVSPHPDSMIKRYGLIQKPCASNSKIYQDLLIHRKDYTLTELDRLFIAEVIKARESYIGF